MSNQDQEIFCHVTPLDIFDPEDDMCHAPMFSIEVIVSFFHLHRRHDSPVQEEEEEEDDEDEDEDYYEGECQRIREVFRVEREKLLNDETSISTIREILTDMQVPIQEYMFGRILSMVHQMMGNRGLMGRQVLRVRVEMEVPIVATDDDDDDVGFVPASNSSIKQLEIINVDDNGGISSSKEECRICLEELAKGMQVTKMPCSHLYHHSCIVDWLRNSRFCPLCRFQMG